MYVYRYMYSTCNICKSPYHKPIVQQTAPMFCLANSSLLLLFYNQPHFQTTAANVSLQSIYCVPKNNPKINMCRLMSFAWNWIPSIAAWLLTQEQSSMLPYMPNFLRLIQYSFIHNKQYVFPL